jgi:hypothetical protein
VGPQGGGAPKLQVAPAGPLADEFRAIHGDVLHVPDVAKRSVEVLQALLCAGRVAQSVLAVVPVEALGPLRTVRCEETSAFLEILRLMDRAADAAKVKSCPVCGDDTCLGTLTPQQVVLLWRGNTWFRRYVTALSHRAQWESRSADGYYEALPPYISAVIEHAFATGLPLVEFLDEHGKKEAALLAASPIVKVSWPWNRGWKDAVRLRRSDAAVPSGLYWDNQFPDEPIIVQDVDAASSEWEQIDALFFGSAGGAITNTGFRIVRIRRVQNLFQRRSYEAQREVLVRDRGADGVNELRLFHGTRTCDPHVLVYHKEGFMTEFASVRVVAVSCANAFGDCVRL